MMQTGRSYQIEFTIHWRNFLTDGVTVKTQRAFIRGTLSDVVNAANKRRDRLYTAGVESVTWRFVE